MQILSHNRQQQSYILHFQRHRMPVYRSTSLHVLHYNLQNMCMFFSCFAYTCTIIKISSHLTLHAFGVLKCWTRWWIQPILKEVSEGFKNSEFQNWQYQSKEGNYVAAARYFLSKKVFAPFRLCGGRQIICQKKYSPPTWKKLTHWHYPASVLSGFRMWEVLEAWPEKDAD